MPVDKGAAGYSLHQLQGDKHHGVTRSGHLLKKSEGKMRRVWQKRKCRVQAEGYLEICHADESKPPTKVNLLTCQIKVVPDDKRGFDLISCKGDRRKRCILRSMLCRQSDLPFPSGRRGGPARLDVCVDQLQGDGADESFRQQRENRKRQG